MKAASPGQLGMEAIGYIHKEDLKQLLSGGAGNHVVVGLDTPECWPSGVGESKPYDWLTPVYVQPAPESVGLLVEAAELALSLLSSNSEVSSKLRASLDAVRGKG